MTYGFGLIGCGGIAPVHADAIGRIPNARLVAVCDIVEAKARAFAQKYGAEPYLNYRDLLARDDIHAVNVVTWSGTHADIGMDAARAGKHVIITKPMDISLEKIDRLIAACRESNVKLGATHQFRSYGCYRRLKRAIDDGRLGRLFLGNAFVKWWRAQDYYDSADWRGTWALDGGGALMNQSVHWVDILQWLMGPVKTVSAYTRTMDHQIEVEDLASAAVEFTSGAVGVIQGSTCIYKGQPQRVEVHGNKGNVIVEAERITEWQVEGEEGAVDSEPAAQTSTADPLAGLAGGVEAHVVQIQDVLRAIEENRDPDLGGEEARKAVAVVLAIYESARTGRPAAPR